jgi:hypothetical protein
MMMMTFTPAAGGTENEVLIADPVLYTAQGSVETMISDTPLSNVATFFGLAGRVELGTFETLKDVHVTVAQQPTAAEQLSAQASGDWFVASKDAAALADKRAVKVNWKGVLNRLRDLP